jgi:hypothetical protein
MAIFPCPRGCLFTFGGIKTFKTLKGWKNHMQEKHGGATDAEFETVAAASSADTSTVKTDAQLDAEAVDPASPEGQEAAAKAAAEADAPEAAEKARRLSAREQRKLNEEINANLSEGLHTLLDAIPRAMFEGLAKTQDDEVYLLTPDESEKINKSFEVALKAMGIDSQIQPYNVTLKSPLWLLLYPVVIILFYLVKKKKMAKPRPEPEPEQVQA